VKAKSVSKEGFLKPYKEVEAFSPQVRRLYFAGVQRYCKFRRAQRTTNDTITDLIAKIAPSLRNYEIEIYGVENIPDETAVFLCNHSNSHDFFTIREVFYRLSKRVTPLGAWDGLNLCSRLLFRLGDVTLIKRDSAESKREGILDFCSKF